mmetsp:Transcript_16274/g.22828  ORF Transcript_16274/g.22828 Transcript_16274/m.22828 type:complete len:110 (+) Transcript_16274:544-873(+)
MCDPILCLLAVHLKINIKHIWHLRGKGNICILYAPWTSNDDALQDEMINKTYCIESSISHAFSSNYRGKKGKKKNQKTRKSYRFISSNENISTMAMMVAKSRCRRSKVS